MSPRTPRFHCHCPDPDPAARRRSGIRYAPRPCVEHWDGDELPLAGGLTLLVWVGTSRAPPCCIGPRVPGERRAALGDVVMVVGDTSMVSFMWRYPNLDSVARPRGPAHRRRARAVGVRSDLRRLVERVIRSGAKDAVHRGVRVYQRALQ